MCELYIYIKESIRVRITELEMMFFFKTKKTNYLRFIKKSLKPKFIHMILL